MTSLSSALWWSRGIPLSHLTGIVACASNLTERALAVRPFTVPVTKRTFFDRMAAQFSIVGVILVISLLIAALITIPVGGSILAYHWLDRPDRYVDGRWFTVGCIAFWLLFVSGGSSRRSS